MNCRLCLRQAQLCNSHIIPEFFFKPSYDSMHRMFALSTSVEHKTHYEQKGPREKLLCAKCDNEYLGGLEKYANEIFFGGKRISYTNMRQGFKIGGVDYTKFKLFQMSLLWRASVSKLPFFEEVRLGPHEEKLRKLLLDKNPGEPEDYACMMVFVKNKPNSVANQLIVSPERLRVGSYTSYRFVLGGCMWCFFVARHFKALEGPEYFISRAGEITIPVVPIQEVDLFIRMAHDLKRQGKV